MLLLGWLAYELSGRSGLGATIGVVKLAWNDLVTADWLRRTDPHPHRRAACFWLHIACGLWKVAVGAAVLVYALFCCEIWRMARQAKPPQPLAQPAKQSEQHLIASMLEAVTSVGLAVAATLVGFCVALRYRVKVWIDFATQRARRRDVWPPDTASLNLAGLLFFAGIIATGVAVIVGVALIDFGQVGERLLPQNQKEPPAWFVLVVFCPIVIAAWTVLMMHHYVSQVIARHPSECWGIPLPISENE